MPLIVQIFAPAAFSFLLVATFMILLCKRPEITTKEIFLQGSAIYRNLNSYVLQKHIKTIMLFTYLGIGCFVVVVIASLMNSVGLTQ
jgi:hypothetical protein